MDFKRVLIFGAVFISLAAIYFFMETPDRKSDGTEQPEFLFPGFNMKNAALIEVKSAEKGKFVLTRSKHRWQVENNGNTYTASTDAVEKLLDAVAEIKIETIASKNDSLDLGLIADDSVSKAKDLGEPVEIATQALNELNAIQKQLKAMIKELFTRQPPGKK